MDSEEGAPLTETACRASPPTVWVLLGKGTGGNGQMLSLAAALGWPYETKQLVHNPLNRCPNLLLGASLLSLNHRRSSPLRPPWPDLVIAASRRSVPVARWIKKQSAGHTRLVHLLHTQAPLALFDLVITLPQYCLPQRPNVLHLTAPLNRLAPERLAEAASRWASRLEGFVRPYTALFVGGNSSSYVLDPVTAARLAREASAQVRASGGSLLLSTSPRTPVAAADALLAAVTCPAYCHRWHPHDPENPYLAFLALADRFIVTADSASMLVEACATAKPVALFEWPRRAGWRFAVRTFLRPGGQLQVDRSDAAGAAAPADGPAGRYDRRVDLGLIKPRRDFDAYHRALKVRGLVTRLGESADTVRRQPLDDMARAVARVRALLAD
ncbi:MAG: mitochondrial fission ELM1 family protein [Candidatus Binatia bacterium]